MVKAGVVLIVLSFALLAGLFLLPDLLTPLSPLYCPAGEALTRSTFTYSLPGETSTTLYFHCVDADGVEKLDVSEQVTISIIALFLVMELSGFALTTIGGRRRVRAKYRSDSLAPDPAPSARSNKSQSATHQSLSVRLRELQSAYQEGLIDSDEYGRLREEALHKLD